MEEQLGYIFLKLNYLLEIPRTGTHVRETHTCAQGESPTLITALLGKGNKKTVTILK
jgi:hypothetical protein